MDFGISDIEIDYESGGVALSSPGGRHVLLHALWLRERAIGLNALDPVNGQRLYEPAELAPDLHITGVKLTPSGEIELEFSDGVDCRAVLPDIAIELGWCNDPQAPPAAEPWDASLSPRPEAFWSDLENPEAFRTLLASFYRTGFCVIRQTPTKSGSLAQMAQRFGYIRETHFGVLFDVVTKQRASDLAYTDIALAAHTDNPYRQPIPGIQFLHCLENTVAGGLSTLVDGFALVRRLALESPEQVKILSQTPVRFRYESDGAILQHSGPLIEYDLTGRLVRVRLSSRLDFAPPLEPDMLKIFYAGRRRLQLLAGDPEFEIRYAFEPGMLLMMDNYRTLHGRTAFDQSSGRRHLQGCYIDHDGPDGLYRMLVRDGAASVGRNVE